MTAQVATGATLAFLLVLGFGAPSRARAQAPSEGETPESDGDTAALVERAAGPRRLEAGRHRASLLAPEAEAADRSGSGPEHRAATALLLAAPGVLLLSGIAAAVAAYIASPPCGLLLCPTGDREAGVEIGAAAGALAGVSIVMFLVAGVLEVDAAGRHDDTTTEPEVGDAAERLSVTAGPGDAGLGLRLAF